MRISTRLNLIEKQLDSIIYRYKYDSTVRKDANGMRWFTDNRGNEVPEDQADEKLIPERVIVFPFKLETMLESVYGKAGKDIQKPPMPTKTESLTTKMASDLSKAYG